MNPENDNDASPSTNAERAARPFAILDSMNVPCGYERSFKMLDGKVLANRFLLGVNSARLTRDNLLNICRQLNMPDDYMDRLGSEFGEANLVFFGFEDNEPNCFYKVYLEFWDKLRSDIPQKRNQREPALLHLGFKWDTEDNSQRIVSKYMYYPLLSVEEVLARVSGIYANHVDQSPLQVVTEIIKLAASRTAADSLMYLEVDEENNARNSFDLNLYNAMIRLSEIQPELEKLRIHYAISPETFARLYGLVAGKLLGHLSGGLNRQGSDFVTIYFEA